MGRNLLFTYLTYQSNYVIILFIEYVDTINWIKDTIMLSDIIKYKCYKGRRYTKENCIQLFSYWSMTPHNVFVFFLHIFHHAEGSNLPCEVLLTLHYSPWTFLNLTFSEISMKTQVKIYIKTYIEDTSGIGPAGLESPVGVRHKETKGVVQKNSFWSKYQTT